MLRDRKKTKDFGAIIFACGVTLKFFKVVISSNFKFCFIDSDTNTESSAATTSQYLIPYQKIYHIRINFWCGSISAFRFTLLLQSAGRLRTAASRKSTEFVNKAIKIANYLASKPQLWKPNNSKLFLQIYLLFFFCNTNLCVCIINTFLSFIYYIKKVL